jgi:hypothetical protein
VSGLGSMFRDSGFGFRISYLEIMVWGLKSEVMVLGFGLIIKLRVRV